MKIIKNIFENCNAFWILYYNSVSPVLSVQLPWNFKNVVCNFLKLFFHVNLLTRLYLDPTPNFLKIYISFFDWADTWWTNYVEMYTQRNHKAAPMVQYRPPWLQPKPVWVVRNSWSVQQVGPADRSRPLWSQWYALYGALWSCAQTILVNQGVEGWHGQLNWKDWVNINVF